MCFLMKKVMCKDYMLSDFNHKTFWKRPNNGDSKNSGYHGCSGGGLVSKRRELEQNLFCDTLILCVLGMPQFVSNPAELKKDSYLR